MPEPTNEPTHEPTGRPSRPEDHEPTARLDHGDDYDEGGTDVATDVLTDPHPPGSTGRLEDRPRASGRHPVKIGYLVAGLLALGMALVWLLSETGVVHGPATDGVGVSLVLIAAGLAGLLASVGRTRRRSDL